MHNKWISILLAVLLIIFAFWETGFSKWIIAAIGAFMLIKVLFLKKSRAIKPGEKPMNKKTKKR